MLKDFFHLISRFIPPYKWKLALNILFNILSTILSLFSFAAIIPVLQILFGVAESDAVYIDPSAATSFSETIDILKNDAYWFLGERIAAGGADMVLMLLGVVLIVLTGLKCGCQWLGEFYMIPIRTGVLRDLRVSLYRKVVGLPIGYFTEERKGDVISRMTTDVAEVEASIMSSLNMLFRDPIMIIIYLVWLCILSWQLTVFVLILLPTAGWAIGAVGRSLKRRSNKGMEQTGELLTQIEETLGGLRVVKAFNAESKLISRFIRQANDTRRTFVHLDRKYSLAHPMSEFLGTAMIAVLLWFGGSLILSAKSSIDAATFIYYLVIFYSIINPAKDLTKATYAIRKGVASLDRIDKILTAHNPIQEVPNPVPLDSFDEGIEYSDVCFSYQEDRPVLRHVNLSIPKGKTVALVGQSGSGKTTMADLLPRFYDVQSGAIRIDGVDIRSVRPSDLRALMGNVNQEAILFNDSFYNNITFGVDTSKPAPNGETWEEAVVRAAKIANAHEFIMATPDGYQTGIGDRGSRLSGGQRQRISIARAILKNPPILILDEATSALDTESEKLVQEALEHLMADRTTLVVAHRLSTIRNADLICVMHEGEIVEQGRHEELLALGGYYKKLIDMQKK